MIYTIYAVRSIGCTSFELATELESSNEAMRSSGALFFGDYAREFHAYRAINMMTCMTAVSPMLTRLSLDIGSYFRTFNTDRNESAIRRTGVLASNTAQLSPHTSHH